MSIEAWQQVNRKPCPQDLEVLGPSLSSPGKAAVVNRFLASLSRLASGPRGTAGCFLPPTSHSDQRTCSVPCRANTNGQEVWTGAVASTRSPSAGLPLCRLALLHCPHCPLQIPCSCCLLWSFYLLLFSRNCLLNKHSRSRGQWISVSSRPGQPGLYSN